MLFTVCSFKYCYWVVISVCDVLGVSVEVHFILMLKYSVMLVFFLMIQVPPLFLDVRPEHFILDSKQLMLSLSYISLSLSPNYSKFKTLLTK